MCTRGGEVVSSALPSLVTVQVAPVSAMRKLAPEIATSALRNLSRSSRRALSTIASMVSSRCGARCDFLNISDTCSRVRCIDGQTMCEGRSPASCTMCSARSVSTRSMPAASSACGRPISSPSIDLTRVTRLALGLPAQLDDDARGLLGRRRPVHLGAGGDGVALELEQVVVEVGDDVVLDPLAAIARGLELREGRHRGARLRSAVPVVRSMAILSVGSASAASTRARKETAEVCIASTLARRWAAPRHAGQHLGGVDRCAPAIPCAAACRPCSSGSRGRRRAAGWAPLRSIASAFSATTALEIAGYLTQKVPPNPQHTSLPSSGFSSSAGHGAEQARGCS
jgi:hypothetical protein